MTVLKRISLCFCSCTMATSNSSWTMPSTPADTDVEMVQGDTVPKQDATVSQPQDDVTMEQGDLVPEHKASEVLLSGATSPWLIMHTPADTDVEPKPRVTEVSLDTSDSDEPVKGVSLSVKDRIEVLEKKSRKTRKQRRKAAEVFVNVNVEDLRQRLQDMQMAVLNVDKSCKKAARKRAAELVRDHVQPNFLI